MTSLATRILAFGGTTVQLEYTAGRAAEIVEFLFRRIPRAASATAPKARLRLLEDPADGMFTLSNRGEVCCVDRSAGAIASWLLHVTCRQLAEESAGGLLLHAAVLRWGGRGLLLSGASGCGKTTLTTFLSSRGFDYLTDELAYLPSASNRVEGFTGPLKLKKSGLDALKGYVSLSADAPGSIAGPGDVLVNPDGSRWPTATVPLSVIVFPGYQPRSRFRLEALSPAQTGLRLMAGLLNAERLPDHGFGEVARVAGLIAGYDLRYANLAQVEAHLGSLRRMTSASRRVRGRDARRSTDLDTGRHGRGTRLR